MGLQPIFSDLLRVVTVKVYTFRLSTVVDTKGVFQENFPLDSPCEDTNDVGDTNVNTSTLRVYCTTGDWKKQSGSKFVVKTLHPWTVHGDLWDYRNPIVGPPSSTPMTTERLP